MSTKTGLILTIYQFGIRLYVFFKKQKRKLVTSLIFISPNLALQFELMCDASDMPVIECWDKER